MEITETFYLKQENTNLLDKKSEATEFKNGLAMIGVAAEGFDTVEGDDEEEFANPVMKEFLDVEDWTGIGDL